MSKSLSATQLKRFEQQLREKANKKLLTEYGYQAYDTDGYKALYDDMLGKAEVAVSAKKAALQSAFIKKKVSKRAASRITSLLSEIEALDEAFDLSLLTIPAAKNFIKAIHDRNDAYSNFLDEVKQHNDQINADTEEILNEAIFRDADWAIEALKNF